TPLTDRDGPEAAPTPSPDGKLIAYAGYDDDVKSYQMTKLFLMDADGKNQRALTAELDHGIDEIIWASDGKSIYVQVENAGAIDVMEVTLDGKARKLFSGIGGTSIGRHYAGGSFTVSKTDTPVFAYTAGFADRPAEVAVKSGAKDARVLTALNDDLLTYLDMAPIEELKVKSSVDGREIEAWVALPPGFKADGSFPMVLEIHGGPFTMYAPFFASEIQRYAAEGYVTLYVNPRGSTGYGEDFAQLIDRAYPGDDVQDLMDMVDLLVKKNYVDEDRLFVTGGSGGGILTAWIVTKTNRFAAAASVKPVINWMTMALAADIGQYVRRHWIREDPWTNPEAYLKFSPISYVHQVKTPTLMMVGEEDFRTPTWEAEQFYTGLKMNGVETALIRVPGSSHYIARRPSQLIAKTDNIMGWFKKHDPAHKKTDGDK
ncbi:MAG: S9 family peptidase, partial [Pseudomonadota bacterium]